MGRTFFKTSSYSFPYALAALLLTGPLVGQEYRGEKDETLGIRFRVHRKLTRTQAPYAGRIPHYRYWYNVAEEGDAIQTRYGPFHWYIFVLEFPKDLSGVPESRILGRTFREWATRGDPSINQREMIREGQEKRARGNQLAHTWWEFRDTQTATIPSRDLVGGITEKQVDQPLHYVAAVYDQPDREIALVGIIPIKDYRTLKPDARFQGYLTTMVTSLQFLERTGNPEETAGPRENILRQAETIAETTRGWDYVPGASHAVLYSWDPDKSSRKRDSERFAKKVADGLERMNEQFAQELPAHAKQTPYFPVVQVFHGYEEFLHNAGTSQEGAVALYNGNSRQVIVHFDKDRERVRNERELLGAVTGAAWRQYANYYFFVGTNVDLHRWYEVGLAAWFAAHTVSGNRIRYAPDSARVRNLRASVQQGNYVGLEEFVSLGQNEFDARSAENEAQAYALVDFLKRGADTAEGFDPAWAGILDTYRSTALEGRSPRGALAAAIGQVDLVALEAAWVEWVKAGLK